MRNHLLRTSVIAGIFLVAGCSSLDPAMDGLQYPATARIGTYNVENLFDMIDDPHRSDGPPTTRARLQALAEVILAVDCDILALQEVENVEILAEFNETYLNGMYPEVVLVEGNDPRGIDVAILSRIHLESVVSFRNREMVNPQDGSRIRFSRDVVAVQWEGGGGRLWTLLTTHLKSGVELRDRLLRRVQGEEIARICSQMGYIERQGRGLVVLAGDLNSEPWSDELRALRDLPLSDPARDLPYRSTHAGGKALDYVLLSPDADRRYLVGSYTIYREPPASEASDHYLVYLDLRP